MKMNIHTILRLSAAIFAAATLVSCSLLKVSVSSGDPLPKEEMRLRTMTRGFYYDMASEVARTADSIASVSKDTKTKIAATRWKIRATKAGVSSAMQGIPDVAMADLWILCRRMNESFSTIPDSLLFGPQSELARQTATRLDARAGRLARQVLHADRYALMERFVAQYVRENPVNENSLEGGNTMLAWIEYLRANGIEHAYVTGSISEVLADINDRVSVQTQQLSGSIGWSGDILEMQFQQDSLKGQLTARLDSLGRNFDRMVSVAENLPTITDRMLADLNRQASQLMGTMNASVALAFESLDRQRSELQHYVSQEREELVVQMRDAGDELVRSLLDALPGVIGKALFYIVLSLLLLLGLPFGLGFWLGGIRERARRKRDREAK